MTAILSSLISKLSVLGWLVGPILDKELRVSSRRKRNYLLRFTYVALLTVFLCLLWLNEVHYASSSSVLTVSRMARAGQSIIAFIVWFQFIAIQIVAVIILSNSISDEIYHRTLGLLMTTPINSFQIVMGKLLSKLLQLILLMGISLPLLAIVRVFGGVPWDYVISSLCITLATAIFVGSLSLFFSIFSRRAYAVIITTIITIGVLFGLLPLMAAGLLNRMVSERAFFGVLRFVNPYVELALNTETMFSPGRGWLSASGWPIRCGIILAACACILALSVGMVRKAALRQATGQSDSPMTRKRGKYAFRLGCAALAIGCIFLVWTIEAVYPGGPQVTNTRTTVLGVIWVLLGAVQLPAIIMLSKTAGNTLCGESGSSCVRYAKCLKAITGRFIGAAARVFLMMVVFLPLFGVLRYFCGLSWDSLIFGLWVAFSGAAFAGAVSIFLSAFSGNPLFVTLLAAPALVPCALMNFQMLSVFNPGPHAIDVTDLLEVYLVYWGIILSACVILLLVSAFFVRQKARRNSALQMELQGTDNNSPAQLSAKAVAQPLLVDRTRPIGSSPVLWRELRTPILRGRTSTFFVIAVSGLLFLLFASYLLFAHDNSLDDNEVHVVYVVILMCLGILFTIIIPATSITSEKEARSWPLLLATTLDDSQILLGKFMGVMRRCLPVWMLLFGHVILFSIIGFIHPLAIVQMVVIVAGTIVFLLGTGLYFSSCFRHTTTAVVTNFALAATIWLLMPLLLLLILQAMRCNNDPAEYCLNVNPIFLGALVMNATANGWASLRNYQWCELSLDFFESTLLICAIALGYAGLGYVFMWRARRRLRRNIF